MAYHTHKRTFTGKRHPLTICPSRFILILIRIIYFLIKSSSSLSSPSIPVLPVSGASLWSGRVGAVPAGGGFHLDGARTALRGDRAGGPTRTATRTPHAHRQQGSCSRSHNTIFLFFLLKKEGEEGGEGVYFEERGSGRQGPAARLLPQVPAVAPRPLGHHARHISTRSHTQTQTHIHTFSFSHLRLYIDLFSPMTITYVL